jgi:hypothetical protein
VISSEVSEALKDKFTEPLLSVLMTRHDDGSYTVTLGFQHSASKHTVHDGHNAVSSILTQVPERMKNPRQPQLKNKIIQLDGLLPENVPMGASAPGRPNLSKVVRAEWHPSIKPMNLHESCVLGQTIELRAALVKKYTATALKDEIDRECDEFTRTVIMKLRANQE